MTNPNHPIMSLAVAPGADIAKVCVEFLGLTKREHFAAMAMQGALASFYKEASDEALEMIPTYALKIADALIAELNKEKP